MDGGFCCKIPKFHPKLNIFLQDRKLFGEKMNEIGEKCAPSCTASTVAEVLAAVGLDVYFFDIFK